VALLDLIYRYVYYKSYDTFCRIKISWTMWFIIIIIIIITTIIIIIIHVCSKPSVTEVRCHVAVLCCIMRCMLNCLFNHNCFVAGNTLILHPGDYFFGLSACSQCDSLTHKIEYHITGII